MDVGSEIHRAPEICRHQFPFDGEKADVFAAAFVLFAIQMKIFPVEFKISDIPLRKYKNVIDTPSY